MHLRQPSVGLPTASSIMDTIMIGRTFDPAVDKISGIRFGDQLIINVSCTD